MSCTRGKPGLGWNQIRRPSGLLLQLQASRDRLGVCKRWVQGCPVSHPGQAACVKDSLCVETEVLFYYHEVSHLCVTANLMSHQLLRLAVVLIVLLIFQTTINEYQSQCSFPLKSVLNASTLAPSSGSIANNTTAVHPPLREFIKPFHWATLEWN